MAQTYKRILFWTGRRMSNNLKESIQGAVNNFPYIIDPCDYCQFNDRKNEEEKEQCYHCCYYYASNFKIKD